MGIIIITQYWKNGSAKFSKSSTNVDFNGGGPVLSAIM
jgi:hypothetical protein